MCTGGGLVLFLRVLILIAISDLLLLGPVYWGLGCSLGLDRGLLDLNLLLLLRKDLFSSDWWGVAHILNPSPTPPSQHVPKSKLFLDLFSFRGLDLDLLLTWNLSHDPRLTLLSLGWVGVGGIGLGLTTITAAGGFVKAF